MGFLTVTLRYPYGSLRNCSASNTCKKRLGALGNMLLVTGGNVLLVTGGNILLVMGSHDLLGSSGNVALKQTKPVSEITEICPLGAKAMLPGINGYGYLSGSLRLP